MAGVPPDVGIAGIKDSGYGYEGGRLGIEAFLNLKVVRGAPVAASQGRGQCNSLSISSTATRIGTSKSSLNISRFQA